MRGETRGHVIYRREIKELEQAGRERIGRSRWRLCAALAVTLVCGCQSLSGGSPARPSLPPGFPVECTATFGITQMNRLLVALGSGTPDAVAALIVPPAPHQDGLELAPTMADFLAKGPQPHTTSDLQVHDLADLERLVSDTRELRFELDAPLSANPGVDLQSGPGAYTGPGVGMGPVLWRASGDRVTAAGHRYVKGGGKAVVECPSGLFRRALFSPQTFA